MKRRWSLAAFGLQIIILAAILGIALASPEWRPNWLAQLFMPLAIALLLLSPFGLMSVFFTFGYRFFSERLIFRDEVIRRLARGYPETILMWREVRDDIWRKYGPRDQHLLR